MQYLDSCIRNCCVSKIIDSKLHVSIATYELGLAMILSMDSQFTI